MRSTAKPLFQRNSTQNEEEELAPVVQKEDSAKNRINYYPLENETGFPKTCPLNGNLSVG